MRLTSEQQRQTQESQDALSAIQQHQFVAGEYRSIVSSSYSFSVSVLPLDEDQEKGRQHLISLIQKFDPPPRLKELAYGVFDSSENLVSTGETNESGQFTVRLTPSTSYTVRYVTDISQFEDALIIHKLNDSERNVVLTDAIDDEEMSEELRQRIRDLLSD
jgi:hypothetical protein